MTITLIILGILILTVVAMFAIGAMLRSDHRSQAEILVRCDPEQVWKLLADPINAARWRSDLSSAHEVSPNVVREVPKRGDAMIFETLSSNPPSCLVRRIVDTGLPFGGQWKITIEPEHEQSRVIIVEDGFVKPPFFKFVSRFVMGHDRTIKRFLKDLKSYCDKQAVA